MVRINIFNILCIAGAFAFYRYTYVVCRFVLRFLFFAWILRRFAIVGALLIGVVVWFGFGRVVCWLVIA